MHNTVQTLRDQTLTHQTIAVLSLASVSNSVPNPRSLLNGTSQLVYILKNLTEVTSGHKIIAEFSARFTIQTLRVQTLTHQVFTRRAHFQSHNHVLNSRKLGNVTRTINDSGMSKLQKIYIF